MLNKSSKSKISVTTIRDLPIKLNIPYNKCLEVFLSKYQNEDEEFEF